MDELKLIERSIEKYPDDPNVYRDAVAILYDEIQHGHTELHEANRELRKKISALRKSMANA